MSNPIHFAHAQSQPHFQDSEARIRSLTYQSSQPLQQHNPKISLSLSNFGLASAPLPNQTLPFLSALTAVPPSDVTVPTPISPAPNSRSASLTHSCGTANQSATNPSNVNLKPQGRLRRVCKRDRSLQVMKAIAANSAPDVSLSDRELLEIGAMHESESQLAESRAVYMSLVSFKNVVTKYGYRLTALHLDVVSEDQPNDANEPFDFVLNKNATTSRAKEECKTIDSLKVQNQQSSTPSSHAFIEGAGMNTEHCTGMIDGFVRSESAGSIAGKRQRFCGNSYSSSSGEHDVGNYSEIEGISCVYGDELKIKTEQVGSESVKLQECVEIDNFNDSRPRKRARACLKGESTCSGGQRLGCGVCGKLMSDNDTLVRHFRHAHQELKPFSCPRCGGFYSSEGTLWHHIRNVHTETPRKYRCSYCDASYDSFGAKTRHEHATHSSGSSQFVCSFEDCGRSFNFPAHLEAHALQMHPGFRPFSCDECPKSFPSANGLTRHAREVHQRPQAYSCSCNRSYSKRCHLKRHLLRVHGMSVERVQEEMKKQPHPGLLHMVPRAPPASTD